MRRIVKKLGVAAFGALLASSAMAASIPIYPQSGAVITPPLDPSNLFSYLNQVLQSVNQYASGYQPENILDNGAATITQRGTSEATGADTSGCAVVSYVVDRWCIDTNVASGAGFGQVKTSSPTPPPGFSNVVNVYRKTGALTQPVCLMQEIETTRFVQLQGKPVIISAYVAALAGAPSGMVVTGYLFTGTGTNQGLGALQSAVGMTASPALTPAWTGIATASQTMTITPTTSFARASSGQIPVPVTATEGAVAFCFTPGAETAGTTNGFSITGMQLEVAGPNQTTAGAFQFLPPSTALERAQRYFWQISDPAATVNIPSSCNVTTANTTVKCGVWLPQQMWTAPVTAVATATSFGIWLTAGTAGTCTTLAASASSNTVNNIGVTCTTGGTIALGTGTNLIGAAVAAGRLNASADF